MPVGPPKLRRQGPTEPVASGIDASTDWFAVAEDGESALRIAPGLTIGETASGALALNDRNPQRQWIVFDVDPVAGFTVRAAAEGWRLLETGRPVARQRLCAGLTLALPNNILRISRSIAAPAPGGPLLQVITQADLEARPPAAAPVAIAQPGRAAMEPGGIRSPAARAAGPGSRGRGWPAVAVGIALAVVGGAIMWRLPTALETPVPAGQAPSEPVVDIPTAAAGSGASVRPAVHKPDSGPAAVAPAMPSVAPDPGVEARPAASSPVALVALPEIARRTVSLQPAPPAPPDPALTARLVRAEALLESGRITYPPADNAVAILVDILHADPGNEGAMALLGLCTSRLIDQAVAARAAGHDFEARNVLEEVLGFNPEHPRANELWESWVGAPR